MSNTDPAIIAAALETALALQQSATPDQTITGTDASVLVSGTAGNDSLQGLAGSARVTLAGGAGDDTYTVAHYYDIVQEAPNEGVDTVILTGTSFTLPDQVENLVVLSDRGYGGGNALNNRIEGNDYAQVLNGGAGTDLLTGGGGADIFQILAGGGWDVITDFTPGVDKLHLGTNSAEAALASLRQDGANVVLDLGDGLGVTFLNRSVADFSLGDFLAPPDTASLTLTFDDEFNSFVSSADGSSGWRTTYSDGARAYLNNGDRQYFSDATVGVNPFRIEDGALVITASPGTNALGLAYNSGLITTAGSFSQLYGYFETRLSIPAGDGWWPAFWMLSTAGGWPPELDILESFGNGEKEASFSAHSNLGAVKSAASIPVDIPDITAGYHTFGVSWLPDEIRWYVDGVEVASLPTPADMNTPMYLLLDLAISNLAAAAGTSADLFVDYVRAYAYSPETIAAHTNTSDGMVSAVSATLPDGMHSLTLYGDGPLTGTGNALDNYLLTTAGAALLRGLDGNDQLVGGAGDDTLDGGTGMDRMLGGAGNDTYFVDNTGDKVIETPGAGTDLVISSVSYTLGTNLENLMLTGSATLAGAGNALDNHMTANGAGGRLSGLAGNDTLIGGAGADTLDGGTGADSMAGGAGNDSYVVDNAGDVVLELPGDGIDAVYASISYTLGADLEKLVLTGTADLSGTGNTLDNSLTGNAGANLLLGLDGNDTLDGGAGADTMIGGIGNDTYTVDDPRDLIVEAAGAGTDSVRSTIGYTLGANLENLTLLGTASIGGMGNALANRLTANAAGSRLYGLDGNDTLTGGAGNDILDGGTGNDSMLGGAGDDIYYVDSIGDRVVEAANGGNDAVYASVSYTLGANLEKLVLTGTAAIDGTGNDLDNRIFGNAAANRLDGGAGNDWLDGGAGADTMVGGSGDDTFIVDNAGDQVVELPNGGEDAVYASVSYTLGANLEKLVLTGTAAIDGTGNDLDNRIFGNAAANRLDGDAGNDWIEGGAGNDTLTGGSGDDTFSFAPGSGADVVTDFGNGHDRIVLAPAFHAGTGGMVVTHMGADTVLTFSTGDSITLLGVTAITLQGDVIIA